MGYLDQKFGLIGRVSKGSSHHDWVSRDYQDVDCLAVACMFNRDKKCMVPSRANFGPDARCTGFQLPPQKGKVDGD